MDGDRKDAVGTAGQIGVDNGGVAEEMPQRQYGPRRPDSASRFETMRLHRISRIGIDKRRDARTSKRAIKAGIRTSRPRVRCRGRTSGQATDKALGHRSECIETGIGARRPRGRCCGRPSGWTTAAADEHQNRHRKTKTTRQASIGATRIVAHGHRSERRHNEQRGGIDIGMGSAEGKRRKTRPRFRFFAAMAQQVKSKPAKTRS